MTYEQFEQLRKKKLSEAVKVGLARAKKRGVRLGSAGPDNLRIANERRIERANAFARKMRAFIRIMQRHGLTQDQMVECLNKAGIPAARGGKWHKNSLYLLLLRIEAL